MCQLGGYTYSAEPNLCSQPKGKDMFIFDNAR